MKTFLRGLISGLFRTSALSTWLMVGLAVLIVIPFTVSHKSMMGSLQVYPGINGLGESAYANFNALELEADKSEKTRILIVGASTMRETLSSAKDLAEQVSTVLGRRGHVTDMTSSSQPFWLSRDIAKMATCGRQDGVLFLSVNLGRTVFHPTLHKTENIPSMVLDEPGILAAIKRRATFVTYAIKTKSKLSARFSEPSSAGRHRYLDKPLNDIRRKKLVARTAEKWQEIGLQYIEDFYMALEALILQLKTCSGIDIVLIETPINPEATQIASVGLALTNHRLRIGKIAEQFGVSYLDFGEKITFDPNDFHDHGHLATLSSIERTSAILAKKATALFLSHEALVGKDNDQ